MNLDEHRTAQKAFPKNLYDISRMDAETSKALSKTMAAPEFVDDRSLSAMKTIKCGFQKGTSTILS